MTDTEALWAAVDALTKPTTRRVFRDNDPDWLVELRKPSNGFCDVGAYRAATVSHGTIPSLWVQAEMALVKVTESTDGNRSLLAHRSPADVTLMEMMSTIREVIGLQLTKRRLPPRKGVTAQLRQLAAHVVGHEPEHVEWWEYRVSQWARLLETYLQAVEQGPKPMRLRYRCPVCHIEHVTIDDPDGIKGPNGKPAQIVVRPVVAIYRDRMFRCFQCDACASAWFAGAGVYQLQADIEADELDRKPSDEKEMTA